MVDRSGKMQGSLRTMESKGTLERTWMDVRLKQAMNKANRIYVLFKVVQCIFY